MVNPNPEILFYPISFIDSALESPDQARSDSTFILELGLSDMNFPGQLKNIFLGRTANFGPGTRPFLRSFILNVVQS